MIAFAALFNHWREERLDQKLCCWPPRRDWQEFKVTGLTEHYVSQPPTQSASAQQPQSRRSAVSTSYSARLSAPESCRLGHRLGGLLAVARPAGRPSGRLRGAVELPYSCLPARGATKRLAPIAELAGHSLAPVITLI